MVTHVVGISQEWVAVAMVMAMADLGRGGGSFLLHHHMMVVLKLSISLVGQLDVSLSSRFTLP